MAVVYQGATVVLPKRRDSRALLAALAIESNHWLERQTLAARLWPADEPRSARSKLRRHISDVRAWLATVEAADHLETIQGRVRLCVGPGFRVDLGDAPLGLDGPIAAQEIVGWLSDHDIRLLPDLEGAWVETARQHFEQQLDAVLPRAIDELVARQDIVSALAIATQWHRLDRTAEQRYQALIWLTASLGDFEESARWFVRASEALASSLALEVSHASKDLHNAIQRGLEPPWTPLRPRSEEFPDRANGPGLPALQGELFGREQDLERARLRLSRVGRMTVVGTGGVGKTSLALRLAHRMSTRYPDGVGWVDLSALSEPRLVAQHVLESFGLETPPGQDERVRLSSFVMQHRALIVLDNCEHLVGHVQELVNWVWAPGATVHLLATSRIAVGYGSEEVLNLEPLPWESGDVGRIGPAQELLLARVRMARGGKEAGKSERAAAARVAERLEGIPLALELAAARTTFTGLDQVAELLDRYFEVLVDRRRDRDDRQRTMWSAIDWSWRLLEAEQQRLLAVTGVFRGSFDTSAAVEIAGALRTGRTPRWTGEAPAMREEREAAKQVASGLDTLTAHSMVTRIVGSDGALRYRVLEPIRRFAVARLEEAGQLEITTRGHAAYFAELCIAARAGMASEQRPTWHARLDLELDNIRHAMVGLGLPEALDRRLQVGTSLFRYWYAKGLFHWEFDWLRESVVLAQRVASVPDETIASGLHMLGAVEYAKGQFSEAVEFFNRSIDQSRILGDDHALSKSLVMRAYCRTFVGQTVQAREDAEEAERRAGKNLGLRIQALDAQGFIDRRQGRYANARASMMRALQLHRDSDSPPDEQFATISNLGWTAWRTGEMDEALDWFREARMVAETVDSNPMRIEAAAGEAEANLCLCRLKDADGLAREALELSREVGDVFGEANALTVLGLLEFAQENWTKARVLFRRAEVAYRGIEGGGGLATTRCYRAELADRIGDVATWHSGELDRQTLAVEIDDPHAAAKILRRDGWMSHFAGHEDAAVQRLIESLRMHIDLGERFETARCFEAVGRLLARSARPRLAAGALDAGAALRDEIGARPWPADVSAVAEARETIDSLLSDDAGSRLDDASSPAPVGAEAVVAWLETASARS